ncbi:alpha amylase C-terminal domain-containing protein, partial [Vibrio sp. M260118]|uniref:alpha amylase C-terminal domain-containing protein n=1 Tax=Vibrio sp. M260118 TaxID=3020896 RepID=UPI002F40683F
CGKYHDLYAANFDNFAELQDKLYAFARSDDEQVIVIATNFSDQHSKRIELIIPEHLIQLWQLSDGNYPLADKLNQRTYTLNVEQQQARIEIDLAPLATHFLCLDNLKQCRG